MYKLVWTLTLKKKKKKKQKGPHPNNKLDFEKKLKKP
jgi:hypothetical protein